MSALERLSNKFNDVYDLELTEIFKDVVDELWVLSDACKREKIKLKALKNCLDVKRESVPKEMRRVG